MSTGRYAFDPLHAVLIHKCMGKSWVDSVGQCIHTYMRKHMIFRFEQPRGYTLPDVLQAQDLVEIQEAETSIMHRLRGRCSQVPGVLLHQCHELGQTAHSGASKDQDFMVRVVLFRIQQAMCEPHQNDTAIVGLRSEQVFT